MRCSAGCGGRAQREEPRPEQEHRNTPGGGGGCGPPAGARGLGLVLLCAARLAAAPLPAPYRRSAPGPAEQNSTFPGAWNVITVTLQVRRILFAHMIHTPRFCDVGRTYGSPFQVAG